ncbi:MAG: WbqC family protein [Prevotella sp.]|nr:WbqC family protein [Prevotella sp.]
MTALLSTTYFGPVQWYQKLYRHEHVLMEVYESFAKQTYRNRCLIATAQGVQALTVPVMAPSNLPPLGEAFEAGNSGTVASTSSSQSEAAARPLVACNHRDARKPSGGRLVGATRLSNHGHWQHQHWQAITSAYGDSPFLEYYEDDLRPFFFETDRWERLIDYNEAIRMKICELIDIHPHVELTASYEKNGHFIDFRDTIRPKQAPFDPDFEARPYYQVFRQRHGFLPNLSILDLLLNMGPESVFFL